MRSSGFLRGIQAAQEIIFGNPLRLSVVPGRNQAPRRMFFQELHPLTRLLAVLPGILPRTTGIRLLGCFCLMGRLCLIEETTRVVGRCVAAFS